MPAPDQLPTEADVLAALKGVKDPELHRDLVALGMIQDIRIGDGTIALTVNLTTPACPLKGQIEREVRAALESRLGSGFQYKITMGAEVRGKKSFESGDIAGIKNVIAVGSGKGGVGKSTMAASLAFGLLQYGARVGLVDADVYGPSIPTLVGVHDRPMARGNQIMPVETAGLKLMSMGFLLEPDRAVIMRGPMLHGILQQFLRQVEWGPLDYLVIDLPPGTGDVPLSLAQSLPLTGAVVVCTPQQVALADALRAIGMFNQLKVPLLGIIENMSFYELPDGTKQHIFGEGGARKLAEERGVPFLGEMPLQIQLREQGDQGKIGHALDDNSPARPYLLPIVEQLAAQVSIRNLKSPQMPKLEIL